VITARTYAEAVTVARVDTEPLIRLAAALSSRPAELVAAVQLRAGRELADILESPERLRSATIKAFLSSRGPLDAPAPAEEMPHTLAALAMRVGALPQLDRAVLVLVYLEHLTRAEVAGIVDRPLAGIGQALDRALAVLAADPYDIVAVLTTLSWRSVDPADLQRATVRLADRQRSRSRRRLLVGAAVVVLTAALVVPGVLNPPTPTAVWVRGHRDWVGSYRLDLPIGWNIESQIVGADVETTQLQGWESGACEIVVDRTGAGGPGDDPGRTRPVRVGGRAGRISAGPDRADLTWPLNEGATAAVSCSGVSGAAGFVTELAGRMAFGAQPIALPYRLTALPAHFHVDQVTVRPQQGVTAVDLWPDEVSEASVPISVVQSAGSASGFELPSLSVPGATLRTSCHLLEETSVCAGTAGLGALNTTMEEVRTARRLRLIMDGVVMAGSAADQSTWYDARDALPRD
jgi:hypothetical protein